MTASGATTIARARISGVRSADRALATRLAVAGMLAGADLRPPGLPPSAVLIVNRLALPIDRRLPVRPGGRLDPVWERAARDAMGDLYRHAVRPLDDTPPTGCPAVLFRDEAELLACLALDISRGRAAERWWWRAYAIRWGNLTPEILAPLLAESPRSVPAALRILVERDAAAAVLQHLSPAEATTLLRVICDVFDAPQPELTLSRFTSSEPSPVLSGAASRTADPGSDAPPWLPYAPSGVRFTGLSPESACLLGVALTLAHSPSVAQSSAFTQAVERWWQVETVARRTSTGPAQPAAAQPVRGARQTSLSSTPQHDHQSTSMGCPKRLSALVDRPRARSSVPRLPVFEGSTTSAALPISEELPTSRKVGNSDAPDDSHRSVHDAPVSTQADEPAEWLDGIATELGGVLFLINLMQRLDLPNYFEADWQLASQVGPWGTLELLARGLLSGLPEEMPTFPDVGISDLSADLLWTALAAIDGRRAGELPNGAVTQPASLTIPVGWLRWLEPGAATIMEMPAPLDGPLLTGVSRTLRVWLAGVTPLSACDAVTCAGRGLRRGRWSAAAPWPALRNVQPRRSGHATGQRRDAGSCSRFGFRSRLAARFWPGRAVSLRVTEVVYDQHRFRPSATNRPQPLPAADVRGRLPAALYRTSAG